MINITTTTNTVPQLPEEYKQIGECPHCGAPIYADAKCFKGKKVIALPFPYRTCGCWLTLQPPAPQVITVPYPAPVQPQPIQPTWQPNPWPNTTPFNPTCGDNINICDDGHKTICGGIDWKQFTGSGGCTQDPNLKVVCIY